MEKSDYSREIALSALAINAIMVRPDNPFEWASGTKNPIYNDNRKHLGFHRNRRLIIDAFRSLIHDDAGLYDLHGKVIVGTSTAGIAWGALLAQALRLPFGILKDGAAYRFPELHKFNKYEYRFGNCSVLVNSPWGIPYGAFIADANGIGLMYQREKEKGHGLLNKVEGDAVKGSSVRQFIFEPKEDAEISFQKGEFLTFEEKKKLGLHVKDCHRTEIAVEKIDLTGREVLVIEDLISTGGSSVKEVEQCRKLGATANYLFSIFNYEPFICCCYSNSYVSWRGICWKHHRPASWK